MGDAFGADVTVSNTGHRAGRHVVQLYGRLDAGNDFPRGSCSASAPSSLAAGSLGPPDLTGSTRPLQRWTEKGFEAAATSVLIEAAAFAGDPGTLTAPVAFRLS